MKPYAYLPLVEISEEKTIRLGPVEFSRRTLMEIPQEFGLEGAVTSIAISEEVPEENRNQLAVNALYLLYFATTFRSLYHDQEIPSFEPFTYIVPIGSHAPPPPATRTCIHWSDESICQALGKALEDPQFAGLIRAIRYFVDSFFERFETLWAKPNLYFEPEDILFLSTSFDSLLDLSEHYTTSDFKQKIRPILQLKFSRPLEIFWKWVDGFFALKHATIHGVETGEILFRDNPHFEISYPYLGLKLFIYAVYSKLFQYQLLEVSSSNPLEPLDFPWIHPEEVSLYFWTEESILRKISIILMQPEHILTSEISRADLHQLTQIYSALLDRFYFCDKLPELVHFSPAEPSQFTRYGHTILDHASEQEEFLGHSFLGHLKHRMAA